VENVQKTINELAVMENTANSARLSDGILATGRVQCRAWWMTKEPDRRTPSRWLTERGVAYVHGPRDGARDRA
jgi:hypothetical protein